MRAMLTLGEREATVLRAQTLLTGLGPSDGCPLPAELLTSGTWRPVLSRGSDQDRGLQDVSETLCCSIPRPGQTGSLPAWRGCPCSSTPPLPGQGPYRCQRSEEDIYLLVNFSVPLICKALG